MFTARKALLKTFPARLYKKNSIKLNLAHKNTLRSLVTWRFVEKDVIFIVFQNEHLYLQI